MRPRRDLADVGRLRERQRQRRLARLALLLAPLAAWLWWRLLTGDPAGPPSLPAVDPLYAMSGLFFAALLAVLLGTTVAAGRSPHVLVRPEQLDVRMDDVVGLGPVREEVQRSLDLFLAGRTFRREMGGTPRRGLLFEGPPGTGKTLLAKAMAAEAGVPFLFVPSTSFQSMYYGATARKIRSTFRALRRTARREGGAICFLEEVDAIATARGGVAGAAALPAAVLECGGLVGLPSLTASPAVVSEGVGGVVNELLVQLQSFDEPTGWQRAAGWGADAVNRFLPAHRQVRLRRAEPVDVLVIAATNRADALDPALLRPGRFDRRLVFDLPDKAGRRELVDLLLARKAHEPELDEEHRRDALADLTRGSSPAQVERLLDEALVSAVRRGGAGMDWRDVEHARLVTEVGLGRPVGYTEAEARLIATHEAGHAVTAWLLAPQRRLEVLTIVKRGSALGLLAHGDRDDVWTRSRAELEQLVAIAMGGHAAEELVLGDTSTGPSGDLRYATGVAVQMVGAAGMAGSLVSYAAASDALGTDLAGRVLADADGRRRVEAVLDAQRARALALLAANVHLVEALRDALLERHELVGEEITDVLEAAAAARVVDVRDGRGATHPRT